MQVVAPAARPEWKRALRRDFFEKVASYMLSLISRRNRLNPFHNHQHVNLTIVLNYLRPFVKARKRFCLTSQKHSDNKKIKV